MTPARTGISWTSPWLITPSRRSSNRTIVILSHLLWPFLCYSLWHISTCLRQTYHCRGCEKMSKSFRPRKAPFSGKSYIRSCKTCVSSRPPSRPICPLCMLRYVGGQEPFEARFEPHGNERLTLLDGHAISASWYQIRLPVSLSRD